jgi:hypothetical protein
MKILSIIPVQIPLHVQKFLKLFARFTEVDTMNAYFDDPLFSPKHDWYCTEFRPRNRIFKFNSIYARQRILNCIFRLLINLVYWLISCNNKKSKNKLSCLYRLAIRAIVAINHFNLIADLLYFFIAFSTLRSPGVYKVTMRGLANITLIMFDLTIIFHYQRVAFNFMKKYNNGSIDQIKNQKVVGFLSSMFPFQDGTNLKIDTRFKKNYKMFT